MKIDFSKYENLSPFELKDLLIDAASKNTEKRPFLNAGRGNPNFVAIEPREAFFYFGLFALSESKRMFQYEDESLGGHPHKKDITNRFEIFVREYKDIKGVQLLNKTISYVRDQIGIDSDSFLVEITTAILGCNYPVPGRMLTLVEQVVGTYILHEMGAHKLSTRDIDLFALEGGTAAMTYIFDSLRKMHILKPGDKIALGLPIFQPYIEFAHLKEYSFEVVEINSGFDSNWQYPKAELDKLLDPKVKAFYIVNPTNPSSVKISDESLAYIAEIVKKRPDLIILTDDVYSPFVNNFTSLFAICPKNTILVYSFSKYLGATGWRTGVVAMHKDNIIDEMVRNLPEDVQKDLDHRYAALVVEPRKVKFIDRLLAESRSVALNHTAGLSLPQQVQMMLFSMFDHMDEARKYRNQMKRMKHERLAAFYQGLALPCPHDENSSYYYHIIGLKRLAKALYDDAFAEWLLKEHSDIEIMYRLADEGGLVFLRASAFGVKEASIRLSLANLYRLNYLQIGEKLREIMGLYYKEFKK